MEIRERDITTEVMRIMGCLIVIGTHIKLSDYVGGMPDYGRIFISCIVSDGVAIFWMILGFFFFRKENEWKKLIKKSITNILIPLILISIFTWFFNGFIAEGHSLGNSVRHSFSEYKVLLLDGVLKWRNIIPNGGHLWYLYVYLIIILLYPALQGLQEALSNCFNKKYKILFLLFGVMLLNDIALNELFYFSHVGINGFFGAAFYVMAGHILYSYKNRVQKNFKWGMTGLGLFFSVNIIRTICQSICYKHNYTNFLEAWYTSFGLCATIGIFLMLYGFSGYVRIPVLLSKIICHLGKLTFYIYLIHILVIRFLTHHKVSDIFATILGEMWWGDILYMIGFGLLVFGISYIIAELMYVIEKTAPLRLRK